MIDEQPIDDALPTMQALASRLWSPESRHHPGQLAWSAAYALPEELDHGPVASIDGTAWAWAESDDWLEICVDPAAPEQVAPLVEWFLDRSSGPVSTMVLETEGHVLRGLREHGFEVVDLPWFTHHTLDLAWLPQSSLPEGYSVRAVHPGEHEARSAVHRAAWSATSKVSAEAYERLMATPPYRPRLDWVVLDPEGEMVASCLVWLDDITRVALVEPVGCVPDHRGRGLAASVSIAALAAARSAGATTGLVCPRGDDDYPLPQRIYQSIGFVPGARTLTLARSR